MKYPAALILIIVPMVYLAAEILMSRKKKEAFYVFSSFPDKDRAAGLFRIKHLCSTALYFAGMALFVAALGKPYAGRTVTLEALDYASADTMLVFDISRSMLAYDGGGSRLEKSRSLAYDIVSSSDGRFGISVFKGEGFTLLPLTDSRTMIFDLLGRLDPEMFTSRGTDIGKGVYKGVKAFPVHEKTLRKMIVFTDGEEPVKGSFPELADRIKQKITDKGITMVFVIPDNLDGADVPGTFDKHGNIAVSVPDPDNLQIISRKTGAGVFSFSSFPVESFTSSKEVRRVESYYYHAFAAGGVLLFCAALFIKGRKW